MKPGGVILHKKIYRLPMLNELTPRPDQKRTIRRGNALADSEPKVSLLVVFDVKEALETDRTVKLRDGGHLFQKLSRRYGTPTNRPKIRRQNRRGQTISVYLGYQCGLSSAENIVDGRSKFKE